MTPVRTSGGAGSGPDAGARGIGPGLVAHAADPRARGAAGVGQHPLVPGVARGAFRHDVRGADGFFQPVYGA